MKETRGGGRNNLPHPKPVNRIELSTKYRRLRLILAVAFLIVGVLLIAYSASNLSAKDPGWHEIEVNSSELNCGGEFVFLYCLGAGDASATAENKALTACYSNAAEHAFQLFTNDVEYEDFHNIYYIGRHPNEEMEVDSVLYRAFSLMQESGNRSLYLAPIYEQYNGLFHCTEEYQTLDYDPYRNPDVADYYARIAQFANDARMINLELLGENRICLRVAQEYLVFASENEIESLIDFYWMKNAFIVDYLAEEILSAGYSRGCISSVDGFIRNLDQSGENYAYTFYDRKASTIYPAASIQYRGPSSIVYLRDYALNSAQWQYYYAYSNGEFRTPYIDAQDGLCKSASSDLVCYSREPGCGEILLKMMPVYITETLHSDSLSELAGEGIYSIYCEEDKIYYNDTDLIMDFPFNDVNIRYQAILAK